MPVDETSHNRRPKDGSKKISIIKPARTRCELLYVLSTAMVVVLVCSFIIVLRWGPEQKTVRPAHQISAFDTLSSEELGIFTDLYTAALEIIDGHTTDEPGWLSIPELEDQFVSPFVQDLAWKQRGKTTWEAKTLDHELNHIAMYLGKTNDNRGIGSFLLVCLHNHPTTGGPASRKHAPYEIWYHANSDVDFPILFNDQTLIKEGWKEIVAYKGEDEIFRLKGKEYL